MTAVEQNNIITDTIKRERGRLLNFIRKSIPDEDEAEDVLQDVFYQFTEAYYLMKPIERASSWLFTVARNKITDRFRKKKPVSFAKMDKEKEDDKAISFEHTLRDNTPGPEQLFANKIILEELEEALEELPEEQKEAFVLHELEGRSFEEIAQLTGEKVNTLISRKRYAVLFLRERLREIYEEFVTN